jgi:WD40 repeat protein
VEPGPVRGETVVIQKASKDKRKGVSFLSRFIGSNKKKEHFSDYNDNYSELDENRAPEMDAEVFAQPIGFIPRFPPPPKYMKVKTHYKKQKGFDRVFLAQELRVNESSSAAKENTAIDSDKAVWALEFSKDGKYLAAAGQDRIVRVWIVITSSEDREAHELEEDEAKGQPDGLRLTAPVFKSKPIREYEGHTGSVLDLSWSKNNFLLSSSMDRTVRLWHVIRPECLCCFKHSDFVTSIQFHPRDDRFFLAGSLDSKLRLWSIPDKNVAFWANLPDMITAVAFTPDGRHVIAGCLNGLCVIYETNGLKVTAQIHVRSARGRNAKGSKITGIDAIVQPPDDPNGDVKLLITSNDSRIRLYNFKDRALEAKFRGNENSTSQIRASFSDDGKHVICGSEDRRVYIWPTSPGDRDSDKRAVEVLETRTAVVTSVIMAPTKTRQLLGYSGDPLYDLCNPPRITLVSQAAYVKDSKPDGKNGRQGEGNDRATPTMDKSQPPPVQQSPAYLARSTHPDGNILIVADYSGNIKVFRQDCAHHKRPSEFWDSNLNFSRRLLGRSNSARQSIASSVGRDSFNKTPSERILAWRSSIVGTEISSIDSRGMRTRSTSPGKSVGRLSRYSSPVQSAVVPKTESGYESPCSRSPSVRQSSIDSTPSKGNKSKQQATTAEPQSQTSPVILADPENTSGWMSNGQNYTFWTKAAHTARSANTQVLLEPSHADPSRRKSSVPSALSSDISSASAEEDEVLRCDRCRSTNFRATKAKGKQRLICGNCNTPVR